MYGNSSDWRRWSTTKRLPWSPTWTGASWGGGTRQQLDGRDVEIPMEIIAQTVKEAPKQAGTSPEDVALGMFTLAGADWPDDHARRKAVLEATILPAGSL
jgi:hypothetical protein